VLVAPGVDVLHPEVPDAVLVRIVEAIGTDPTRLYLVRSAYPERAATLTWPANAVVVVEARSTEDAARGAGALGDVGRALKALVLIGLRAGVPEEALRPFGWILVRGQETTQAAFDSVVRAVGPDL